MTHSYDAPVYDYIRTQESHDQPYQRLLDRWPTLLQLLPFAREGSMNDANTISIDAARSGTAPTP